MNTGAASRTELWLPLLREVTQQFAGWSVWKNAESAFHGHGDIDSFAPPRDWPAIEKVFRRWVREQELGPAIVCRHCPQGPHFVTLEPDSRYLVQFDVKVRGTFRGSTLIDVRDLARMSELDEQGFRRIRPGAEGVLKFLYNGMRKGGEPDVEGLAAKRIVELLAADPEGVRLGAGLLGPYSGSVLAAVDALLSGGWDRAALRRVERWAALRAIVEPQVAVSRVWFNEMLKKKRCPVLQVIREHDRRIPDDRDDWLSTVRRNHRVYAA